MSQVPIKRIGNNEYTTIQGKSYKRRVGATKWVKVESPPPVESPLLLMLVRQKQADGEPFHWSLFLAREGSRGVAFQVKGDAIAMHYAHATNVDLLGSESFQDSYIMARPNEQQVARIRYWANATPPPSAPNQAAVQENCQGWTIRVIAHLISEQIVGQNWAAAARRLQQPVR